MSILEGGQVSKMTFGGYDDIKYGKPNSTVHWHTLIQGSNSRYWSISLTAANIGKQNIPLTVNQMIIDSGTSYLLMPKEDFSTLKLYFS